jgi:hypothetical protein
MTRVRQRLYARRAARSRDAAARPQVRQNAATVAIIVLVYAIGAWAAIPSDATAIRTKTGWTIGGHSSPGAKSRSRQIDASTTTAPEPGSTTSSSTTEPPLPTTTTPITTPPTTLPPITPTPPTTTPPTSFTVLWSAGMEAGSLAEWQTNWGGNMEDSGSYSNVASTDVAHSGGWSLKATINTSNGTSGVRAFRWKEPRENRDAYYSVWMYIPQDYALTHSPATGQFWNVFQFKSRTPDGSRNDPVWAFYAQQDAGGLYLQAGYGWGGTQLPGAGKWYAPKTKVYLPIGRWTHLVAFLHESSGASSDGELKFWQDDTQLFDLQNIVTSYENCDYNAWCADNEWSVNLYSDGMSPNPATVYMDDAAILR